MNHFKNFSFTENLDAERRLFLRRFAQSGVMIGSLPFIGACGSNHEYSKTGTDPRREVRTYYFDLSHSKKEEIHYLVMGSRSIPLERVEDEEIQKSQNPLIGALSVNEVTHKVKSDFSSEGVQLCYICTVNPNDPDGVWKMPFSFMHLPIDALQKASVNNTDASVATMKLDYYSLDSSLLEGVPVHEACLHEDAFKSSFDHAVCLISSHPEVMTLTSQTAAYIHKNIVSRSPETYALALKLKEQGPASESGGWATMEPYINEKTGKPYLNTKGRIQYFPRYSDETNTYLGNAVLPALDRVKNDVTLGVNITNLDPEENNPQLEGKMWVINDGVTTVRANTAPANELHAVEVTDALFGMTGTNKSKRKGYQMKITSYDAESRRVHLEMDNWYIRYLGLYLEFRDSSDKRIEVSSLPKETMECFEQLLFDMNKQYGIYMGMLPPVWSLGKQNIGAHKFHVNFVWPDNASSARIFAAGLGLQTSEAEHASGTSYSPYGGGVLTLMFNLVVPIIFMVADAAVAYSSFKKTVDEFEDIEMFKLCTELVTAFGAADLITVIAEEATEPWIDFAKEVGDALLTKLIGTIVWKLLAEDLAEGEVVDSVPVVGQGIAVAAAVMAIKQLSSTVSEIFTSPSAYVDTIKATHEIEVTIYPDPDDTAGFPAEADYYEVKAMFDDATPYTSGKITLPEGGQTDPIVYTFKSVPYGGEVKISVEFCANKDNWLAGTGSTGNVDNTKEKFKITIKENKVPITANTRYLHKKKTVLESDGKHVWKETSSAPSQKSDTLQCASTDGNLCRLNGITVSEHYGVLGYSWKSYSDGVRSCESEGKGQLNQFAIASITADPQKSYLPPQCGFSASPHLVFDLMGSSNSNFYLDTTNGKRMIRQIRFDQNGKPEIDGPNSNRSWGQFRLPSDALVMHPSRLIISTNRVLNKIEVLHLPKEAVSDAEAPFAISCSGEGTRHGLLKGPVASAVSQTGAIMVLEADNKRVQAFDTGLNPARAFANGNYYFPLKEVDEEVDYLDIKVESTGLIYILFRTASNSYYLDIYNKEGRFITRTSGMNAGKIAIDLWRNVYTLNYEVLKLPNGDYPEITEPSVSEWIPSLP